MDGQTSAPAVAFTESLGEGVEYLDGKGLVEGGGWQWQLAKPSRKGHPLAGPFVHFHLAALPSLVAHQDGWAAL